VRKVVLNRIVKLTLALLACASLLASAQTPQHEAKAVRISPAEFVRLRRAVLPDLIAFLNTRDGGPGATEQDADQELQGCTFTPLRLGKLGPAILVTDKNGAASNFNFLAVYGERNGAYQKLVDGAGFIGFLDGAGPAPDIIFTWASGVCHAMYYRLRYSGRGYKEDACDQEYEPAAGQEGCEIRACEKPFQKLPTFPDPYKLTDEGAEVAQQTPKYIVGPEVTAKEIEGSARVESRP